MAWRLKRKCIIISILVLFAFLLFLAEISSDFRPPFKNPRPLFDFNETAFLPELNLSDSCFQWLLELGATPIPALLIDRHVLKQLKRGKCDNVDVINTVKIGVDIAHRWRAEVWDKKFEILFFSNDSNTDYLDFNTEIRRIIPQTFPRIRVKNLIVPTVIPNFLEFWNRSKFVECKNMTMKRDSKRFEKFPFLQKFILKDPEIPNFESVRNLAKLRDQFLKFGIFAFLNGGTFLGWFRECTVIPHTTDMDLAIFSENWNSQFFEFLWSRQSDFRVKRQLGMVNDSYEITVVPKSGFPTPIDIFLLYETKNETTGVDYRWVGGTAVDGTKYKYIYPPYDPYCSADLLGHIFWVTCTPEDKVTVGAYY
ncbi:Protein CBG11699 [Caenorhabditis briggsae]|uniref:Protein CBG11699 n=1 Tax=Caenorhabditis briggsae TaxID=6238 RepID=A8XDX8_CAEBR|nr:Protein CBG11699 [Caenorhabditis briggsae]CAP30873.2 Protein CBG11699 [Caenorhabditis briggsae]